MKTIHKNVIKPPPPLLSIGLLISSMTSALIILNVYVLLSSSVVTTTEIVVVSSFKVTIPSPFILHVLDSQIAYIFNVFVSGEILRVYTKVVDLNDGEILCPSTSRLLKYA